METVFYHFPGVLICKQTENVMNSDDHFNQEVFFHIEIMWLSCLYSSDYHLMGPFCEEGYLVLGERTVHTPTLMHTHTHLVPYTLAHPADAAVARALFLYCTVFMPFTF